MPESKPMWEEAYAWIRERILRGEPRALFIGAEDVVNRAGVRGRLDTAHVHGAEFLHVVEHMAELRLELGDLLLGEVQPRELRGVADVELSTHRGAE